MTLSCRAQAFSVDNLLRSSPTTTYTASSSSSVTLPPPIPSVNELSTSLELEELLFNSRKRAMASDIINRRDCSNNDDITKRFRTNNCFSNKNPKQDSLIYTHQITPDVFTLERQTQSSFEDSTKHLRGKLKCESNSENVDDQDKLYNLSYPAGLKHSEEKAPLDVSRPSTSKKVISCSKNSTVSTSCFCHGELLFCNHPGIVSVPDTNGSENSIIAELCHADLWSSFHRLGTEMIITKTGRRMFPALKLRITGLYPDKLYIVRLEFVQPDTRKYRYIYHSSRWMVSGSGDTLTTPQCYRAPDGPVSGQTICSQIVSFERFKLTNTDPCKSGQVSLVSMQKFQPQVVIQEVCNNPDNDVSETEQYVIMFPQTSFMAVTAYQNQQITTLKIASNPFAKGFRESGKARIPYESFITSIPNFLSRDATLDYIPGIARSSAWSRAHIFSHDFNLDLEKKCQDKHSSIDHYKVVPENIMKMEREMPAANRCHSEINAVTAPLNPTLFTAQEKPLSIPIPHRYIHPNDYQLYQQQQQRHYQQQLLVPTAPLLHYLLYGSEQQKLVSAQMMVKPPEEDHLQKTPPRTTTLTVKPPPAHMSSLPTTPLYSLKLANPEVVSRSSDAVLYDDVKSIIANDISPDVLNRRLVNDDSHLILPTSHSLVEPKCVNGRSRSSHSSSLPSFNFVLPPRCMTEPSKMEANETCRCMGCRYQVIPSSVR